MKEGMKEGMKKMKEGMKEWTGSSSVPAAFALFPADIYASA